MLTWAVVLGTVPRSVLLYSKLVPRLALPLLVNREEEEQPVTYCDCVRDRCEVMQSEVMLLLCLPTTTFLQLQDLGEPFWYTDKEKCRVIMGCVLKRDATVCYYYLSHIQHDDDATDKQSTSIPSFIQHEEVQYSTVQ